MVAKCRMITKQEHRAIINKKPEDLTLAEVVFLQNLEVKELQRQIELLWKANRVTKHIVYGKRLKRGE